MRSSASNKTDRRYKTRVLVVDDHPGALEVCREYLCCLEGYLVDCAQSYEEALNYLEGCCYDVVVLDIFLVAGRDLGMDLLAYIKGRCPNVQVIMITGYADKSSHRQMMRLRAFDLIEKPFTKKDLVESVIKAAERKAILDERDEALKNQINIENPELQKLAMDFVKLIENNKKHIDTVHDKIAKTIDGMLNSADRSR